MAAAPPERVAHVLHGGPVVEGEAVQGAGHTVEHVLRLHHARAAAVVVHRPDGNGDDSRWVQPVCGLAAAVHLHMQHALAYARHGINTASHHTGVVLSLPDRPRSTAATVSAASSAVDPSGDHLHAMKDLDMNVIDFDVLT